jgi:hypothetical protein
MPEFLKEALDAGFTVDRLARAEEALISGKESSSEDHRFSMAVVSKLVRRKLETSPWQGPLLAPRILPPRTLGDCMALAIVQKGERRSWSQSASSPMTLNSPVRPRPAIKEAISKKLNY